MNPYIGLILRAEMKYFSLQWLLEFDSSLPFHGENVRSFQVYPSHEVDSSYEVYNL